MSHKQTKKLRKLVEKQMKANYMEYYLAIKKWPWQNRLRFAWEILFTPVQKRSIIQRMKVKLSKRS